jgi:hypothetical protein
MLLFFSFVHAVKEEDVFEREREIKKRVDEKKQFFRRYVLFLLPNLICFYGNVNFDADQQADRQTGQGHFPS